MVVVVIGYEDQVTVRKDWAHGRCAIKVVAALIVIVFVSPSHLEAPPSPFPNSHPFQSEHFVPLSG